MADRLGIAIAQLLSFWRRFRRARRPPDDVFKLFGRRRTDAETGAVVGEHFEFLRVIRGAQAEPCLARKSECVPQELLPNMPPRVQWRCVDGSGPNVKPCSMAAPRRVVKDAAGLDRAEFSLGIDGEDAVQVLGEIHDDGDIAALSGQARAAAAREDRRTELPGDRNRADYIIDPCAE